MSFIPIVIRDNLLHFIGKQGCTWACNITLLQHGTTDPIDLTDYSVRGQIRKNYADSELTATFLLHYNRCSGRENQHPAWRGGDLGPLRL